MFSRPTTSEPSVTAWQVFSTYWQVLTRFRSVIVFNIFSIVVGSVLNYVLVPVLYKKFFDALTAPADPHTLVPQLIQIIFFILAVNAGAWLSWRIASFVGSYLQTSGIAELKEQAFNYLIGHSYTFFSDNFTGSLVQRINRYARSFERLCDRLFWNILPLFTQIIGAAIVLWFINPFITLIMLVWVGLFVVAGYAFARWKLPFDRQRAEADSKTTGVLADNITNHHSIQLFAGYLRESLSFRGVTRDQARITRFTWDLNNMMDGISAGLIIAVEFLLFYYAVYYWAEGQLSVGVFVLIQVYILGMGHQLWELSRIIRDYYESMADASEMVEILRTAHGIRDVPGAATLAVPKGEITFNKVSFAFNQTRMVLKDITLRIASGEKLALIGPSGAGKSTLARLILRLYDVTHGSISIDGQDIRRVTQESLRQQVAFVPQDPVLFHRSLRDNIRYGRPEATDEEVERAAHLAHCDEFIDSLSDGYNTFVGERGVKLSGGERQRVAIARAILKDAPILVLDEATSSLDSHSEGLIQEALEVLMKGKTVVVIAHRLSTIRKMDRIVVIKEGRVAEEGTHDELLVKEGSLYASLWNMQAGGFIASDEDTPAVAPVRAHNTEEEDGENDLPPSQQPTRLDLRSEGQV